MRSISLKTLTLVGKRIAFLDSKIGMISGIGRAVWFARSLGKRWSISHDPGSRALSQLDDDQLSNLSESGLRARREARLQAQTRRPACK